MEQVTDDGTNEGTQEQFAEAIPTLCVDAIHQEIQGAPAATSSPPSYAEMIKKKKLIESPCSFKDEPLEQSNKKAKRKSHKEIREEES